MNRLLSTLGSAVFCRKTVLFAKNHRKRQKAKATNRLKLTYNKMPFKIRGIMFFPPSVFSCANPLLIQKAPLLLKPCRGGEGEGEEQLEERADSAWG